MHDVAKKFGGIPLNKPLNFMSTHAQSYPKIAENKVTYDCIVAMEKSLSNMAVHYIPHAQIRALYPQLKPGDIVGIATQLLALM